MMKPRFTSLRQSILCAFSLFLFSPFLTFAQHSESPDPVESAVVSSPIQADFSAYLPVVTHRNEWIVEYSFPTFPNEIRRYSFAADSVLQGAQYYHELVYTGTSGPANWLSTGQFFREVNGRVWKYGEEFAGNEQLIYDMDFAIGDTLLSTADGQQTRTVTAVGTTSLRTLESIFWYGTKLIHDPSADFEIPQFPYRLSTPYSREEVTAAILQKMEKENLEKITGETSIMIMPGYDFKITNALITNFHQPGSTLMLLIAAFVGKDWKQIYEEALQNNYRFLSYGDSSLLLPAKE